MTDNSAEHRMSNLPSDRSPSGVEPGATALPYAGTIFLSTS